MSARCVYFDCFSGASGDMLLGALLDAGCPLDELRRSLETLGLERYELVVGREEREGVSGTKFTVQYASEGQPHRHLEDILAMIDDSGLSARAKKAASAVFWRLARAEARVHGTEPEHVHFHEVGAVDSIVDIVGFAVALDLMQIEAIYASALPLGGGTIEVAHGTLPVPAPATLQILAEAHVPVRPHTAQVELVTPTGAAILAELARFVQPDLTIEGVGYGFGTRRVPPLNAVRVWLGRIEEGKLWQEDEVVLLECNLDDATGQALGYAQERLFEAGALDVWCTPIYMKKNRPGVLLAALVKPAQMADLATLMLRETTTLGVRWRRVDRYIAERTIETVQTPWGPVRLKVKRVPGQEIAAGPEFEDCARLAREAQVPWQTVYDAAKRAWAESR